MVTSYYETQIRLSKDYPMMSAYYTHMMTLLLTITFDHSVISQTQFKLNSLIIFRLLFALLAYSFETDG